MTNGYDIEKVNAALRPRLGWKNPIKRGYDIVDSENQQSDSGRYYNDGGFHSSVTVQNIWDCMPDDEANDEEKNCYLRQLRDANIISMLNDVFTAPEVLDRGMIFRKSGSVTYDTVRNGGKFVGLRFRVSEGDYAVTLINATLLLGGVKTFKLYLFHEFTGKVKEWDVTSVADKQVIVSLNEVLYSNSATVKDGEYLFGYFQDDLDDVSAINYQPVLNQNYIAFGAVPVQADVVDNAPKFENYSIGTNCYGLNVEISSCRDLTRAIVTNARHFDNLLGMMMAAKVIDLIGNSTRSNATERITKENRNALLMQLNGVRSETTYIPGILSQIKNAVKQVREIIFPKPEPMSINIACR